MRLRIGNRNIISAQTQRRLLWCPARHSVSLIVFAVSVLFGLTGASAAQAADPLAWSPATLVDTGPHPINAILDVSCPSTSLCVATDEDGNILTSTDPTGGDEEDWSAPVALDPEHPLERVSCPTTNFCVAVDGYGNAFSTTEPTGSASAWHTTKIDPDLSSEGSYSYAAFISCPTTKLCAVAMGSNELITSTEPMGGASKWKVSTNEDLQFGGFSSLTCQSETLCVVDYTVAEDSSFIYSSTNPTGGWADWSKTGTANWLTGLTGTSCPTSSLCVAGSTGNVVTSTSPATGPWTESSEVDSSWFNDMSCTSESLCVGVQDDGRVVVSTEPTGGASKWKTLTVGGYLDSISSVSCIPGTTTCIAGDYEGDILSSTSPTTDWTSAHVDESSVIKPDRLGAVSCASASLCLAGDEYGRVLYSTDPQADASSWSTPTTVSAGSISALDCVPGLCVGGGLHGYYDQIVASTDPTGGEEAWGVVSDDFDEWTSISCASAKLCVAVANGGQIASSVTPMTPGSWSVTTVVPNSDFTGVSCPSESLCVSTNGANVYTNTNPTDPSDWIPTVLVPEGGDWFTGVACPTVTRCFASDVEGNVWTSADPTDGVSGWTKVKANPEGALWSISCPTSNFCMGMEQDGTVYVSQEPTVEGSWYEIKLTEGSFKDQALQGITCANEELCLATDEGGEIATGTQTLAEVSKHEEPKGAGGGSGGGSNAASGGGSTTTATTAQGVTLTGSTPPPVVGQRQTASPIAGTVSVHLKGTSKFVPLPGTTTIPDGSEVEATNGRVLITVATPNGHTQTAEVWGGRFLIDQERTGSEETRFTLTLPLTGCPRVALPRGSAAALAAGAKHSSGPKSRHLWVSESGGSWSTNGRYVSTTVEGTRWLTQDECNHSEVQVAAGKVKVRDLVNDKTKVLTAGKSYTAARRSSR